jgi:Putative adhesin
MTTPTLSAPPPATEPPQLSPGGRTAIRAILVLAAALLVVGCVAGLGATSWGIGSLRVAADEKVLPADARTLVLDVGDVPAAVRIVADRDAREPRVRMRVLNSSRSDDRNLVVSRDGAATRVTIDAAPASSLTRWEAAPLLVDSAGEITVTLPSEQARQLSLTVYQNRGMLLTETDLDQLDVKGTNGDVVLGGGARRVEIHTRKGDVASHGPVSVTESFVAESVDGDLSVDFADVAPQTLRAVTSTGDITVSLPQPGPYLVNASGDSSSVRVPQTNDPARAVATVTARSDVGDVAVESSHRR